MRTSARPVSRPEATGSCVASDRASPYWRTSVRACRLRSGGIVAGVPRRAAAGRRTGRRRRSCRSPAGRRRARTRSSRSRAAVLERGVGHEHVHGRAGQRQHRAGVGAEHQRHEQLATAPGPAGSPITTTTGSSAATAPLTLMSAVSTADEEHHQHEQPRPARARPVDQLLARPRGDAGRVEALADHEQRGDEQDRRVAEAGQRLSSVRTPVAHRTSAAPIATTSTGHRFQTNRTTTAARIAKVIAMSLMASRRRPGRRQSATG